MHHHMDILLCIHLVMQIWIVRFSIVINGAVVEQFQHVFSIGFAFHAWKIPRDKISESDHELASIFTSSCLLVSRSGRVSFPTESA